MSDSSTSNMLIPIITTIFVGAFISAIYYLLNILKSKFEQKYTASIVLDSNDLIFNMLLNFLAEKKLISLGLNNLECKTERQQAFSGGGVEADSEKPALSYNPGSGMW